MDPDAGGIRILRCGHAADAGNVMNPMQCRSQVEGGVAQALGATLFENVRIGERGEAGTAAFRRHRLPRYADIPRTEVHFMETADAIGPLGAKPMSESPFDPAAPALANALRDATGVRFTQLPLTRDRVGLVLSGQSVSSPRRALQVPAAAVSGLVGAAQDRGHCVFRSILYCLRGPQHPWAATTDKERRR
ncbi:Molybdopterin-binding domain of aldehyde dehydrogenase [Streptomyces atratus]|uniref:Molybdopterin-binding domain of aldehyde dehydrogenase n=1 Tax=Streptomyces atratus TaxID=1893 RepID=A0A1K2ECE8_STRAR|nr:Molybdopterin-binding domain of aldehyde dehydrogenase [Streptomyces atratus]